ncbi:ABC transporter permease, partial [candidate division KSB1 bacterium]|nr:ABC transporter permease [candidate division KSB1 bacterium]
MNKNTSPPRIAEWIIRRFSLHYHRLPALGDLEEYYYEICRESGIKKARRWYWRQALRSFPKLINNLLYWSIVMFKNYLKITYRNLINHKLYSSLNIAGLTVGTTCCIFILLYVQDEMSYDKFHTKSDNIYRIVPTFITQERTLFVTGNSPVFGPMAKEEFPEVINQVRFSRYGTRRVVKYENTTFSEDKFIWADSTLFNVFSFDLINGDPETALGAPNTVIITEEIAEKYFGNENPIGKSLTVHFDTQYRVTGVIKNIPSNSHIRPDFIGSFSSLELQSSGNVVNDLLSNMNYYTYILLRDGTDYKEFELRLNTFFNNHVGKVLEGIGAKASQELQPLTSIYLTSNREDELESNGDVNTVYLFAGIGFLILLLGCLNYVNMATANSMNRAKEVGLRKAVGAHKTQLFKQFIGESTVISIITIILATFLAFLFMPFFNTISGKELNIDIFSNPILAAGLAGIIAVVGILSGIYPAVVLSGFRPVETLRGTLSGGSKKSAFRVVLVSFQFTASIVLIIGTLVIKNQLDYLQNKKLGYDKEQIITFRMRNQATRQKFETIKNELLTHPNIISATASSSLPLGNNQSGAHHPVGEPEDNIILLYGQTVDNDYFDTFGIEIVKGRGFSKDHPTDFTDAALINETTMKELGWESDPLGRQIEMYTGIDSRKTFTIIGVVRDYHFESLQNEIRPLMLYNSTPFRSGYSIISVKVKPDNIQDTVEYLKTKWA